jgi:hypothetical protein
MLVSYVVRANLADFDKTKLSGCKPTATKKSRLLETKASEMENRSEIKTKRSMSWALVDELGAAGGGSHVSGLVNISSEISTSPTQQHRAFSTTRLPLV